MKRIVEVAFLVAGITASCLPASMHAGEDLKEVKNDLVLLKALEQEMKTQDAHDIAKLQEIARRLTAMIDTFEFNLVRFERDKKLFDLTDINCKIYKKSMQILTGIMGSLQQYTDTDLEPYILVLKNPSMKIEKLIRELSGNIDMITQNKVTELVNTTTAFGRTDALSATIAARDEDPVFDNIKKHVNKTKKALNTMALKYANLFKAEADLKSPAKKTTAQPKQISRSPL